ncbi:phage tail tape measure protein [Sphingomonas sp. 3-13AW]|uniref:phage tail tape measure protein n=1 Tax=Sphingomonas sp. 3-13AW TaxID=3050450 RepID=UPI003BB55159
MQALLASLVVSIGVKDAAFKSGMATARAEAKRTGQEFQRSSKTMEGAIQNAAREINHAMVRIGESVAEMGEKIRRAGVGLTVGLTVPLGLVGKSTKDTAASFEQSMNRVRAALLSTSPEDINKLSEAALRLGPSMGRSAIEAAGAVEMLAKNGMSAAQILGGGLESALKLAVVGQSDLSSAADLTTDVLAQFGKRASDLPDITNKVAGALDATKLSFNDYQLAVAQAGGVAGGLGYEFDDFNVALASTVSLFGSGSDAGTAFKTFMTSLSGNSDVAKERIKQLGLEFYDSSGRAKSLAEVADELNTKLKDLSDVSRSKVLTDIFGNDAMRTAISLMNQGSQGIADLKQQIDGVAADQKLAELLRGDAAASEQLSAATEKLSIKLGSVLLPIFTSVKQAIASVVGALANMPPWFYTAVVSVGALAASIGPLVLATTMIAKVALPLLLLRLGPVALAFAAVVNPVGVLIRLLGQLAIAAGASTALGLLGARMAAFAGPIGIAITLLTILVPLLMQTAKQSEALSKAQDDLTKRQEEARSVLDRLATAQGKVREEALKTAKAQRDAARDAFLYARAQLAAARAAAMTAIQTAEKANELPTGLVGTFLRIRGGMNAKAKNDEYQKFVEVQQKQADLYAELDAGIRAAEAAGNGSVNIEDPEKTRRGRKTRERDAARDEASYQDELGRLRVAELEARADLTESIDGRYKAATVGLAEERAAFARSVALDEGLNDAKRATLLAAKDVELEQRRGIAERERFNALAQQQYDMESDARNAEQEALRDRMDLADSMAERRDIGLRLLDLQRKQEEAEIELILATKASTTAEWENARARKDRLDADYARLREGAVRDTEGPAEGYMRDLNRSAAALGETMENTAVSAFQRLNDELADSLTGFLKLKGAAGSFVSTIVSGIARIAIEQSIIKPMAGALFGGGGFLKGLFGGATAATSAFSGVDFSADLAAAGGLSYGGGKASGGRVSPGSWYTVGESGTEAFVPDSAGTIHPNSALRGGQAAPAIIQIVGEEGATFTQRVAGISGNVSVETVRSANMANARRARQRL